MSAQFIVNVRVADVCKEEAEVIKRLMWLIVASVVVWRSTEVGRLQLHLGIVCRLRGYFKAA